MLTDENKQQMRIEAVERMKILKLDKQVISDFETQDIIYVSNIKGKLQKADDEQMELVKQFEEDKQIKIYHIIHQKTSSKDIVYFQYVSNNQNQWKLEKRDLDLGFDGVLCYKITKEIREIGVKAKDGIIAIIKE